MNCNFFIVTGMLFMGIMFGGTISKVMKIAGKEITEIIDEAIS